MNKIAIAISRGSCECNQWIFVQSQLQFGGILDQSSPGATYLFNSENYSNYVQRSSGTMLVRFHSEIRNTRVAVKLEKKKKLGMTSVLVTMVQYYFVRDKCGRLQTNKELQRDIYVHSTYMYTKWELA